MRRKFSTSC